MFHCIQYTFYIQEFLQNVSWIQCVEYVFFIIQDYWATLRLPLKTELP